MKETVFAERIINCAGSRNYITRGKKPEFYKFPDPPKLITAGSINTPEAIRHEQKVIEELRNRGGHPHLHLDARFEDNGNAPYLVFSGLNGATVEQYHESALSMDEYLHPQEIAIVGIEVADALSFVHESGIVHNDVKPGNIMVVYVGEPDSDGMVEAQSKLIDFGLAFLKGKHFESGTEKSEGNTYGTPEYMAPEVIRNCIATPLSDVYSLGATMYFLLENEHLIDTSKIKRRYWPPRKKPVFKRDDVPQKLQEIILKAFAEDRRERFHSAQDMKDALLEVIE